MYIIGFFQIKKKNKDKQNFRIRQHWGLSGTGEVAGRVPLSQRTFPVPLEGTIHCTATSNTECLHTQRSRPPRLMGSVPTRLGSDEVECSHLRTHSHSRPITNAFYLPNTSQDDEDRTSALSMRDGDRERPLPQALLANHNCAPPLRVRLSTAPPREERRLRPESTHLVSALWGPGRTHTRVVFEVTTPKSGQGQANKL